jgi:hypothetical protein
VSGDFEGHDVVNVRVWFQDRDSGEMRPGKDGIAIRAVLLNEVIEVLQSAKEKAP